MFDEYTVTITAADGESEWPVFVLIEADVFDEDLDLFPILHSRRQ